MPKLRIGEITYTNTWPVVHFFEYQHFRDQLELTPQYPSQLNQQMAEGKVDLGVISSFAYAEQAGKYAILPDLSVSSYGTVGSISLFYKTDLKEIANKKIALTNTSATSVNLLKIILEEFMGGKPQYVTMAPKLDLMMEEADAALLIGDEALLAGLENEKNRLYHKIDLGEEWRKNTDHWMTFAVWAVRKEVIEEAPDLLYQIYLEFIKSKQKGKEKLDLIIRDAQLRYGGTDEFWYRYFKGLSHDFTDEHIKGLKHYYQLAHKIGVLKKVPDIEIIDFEKMMLRTSAR